jgi:hypothetical protein
MQDTGKKRTNAKDQFYTKRGVAEDCVRDILHTLPWSRAAQWIEPSAGSGAFLGIFKGRTIALDCEPKVQEITQADFLTWSCPETRRLRVYFGNPPFGKQGSLAKKFLQHACEQGADALAFILPRSFMKPSMYGCIPRRFHLSLQKDLPKNSFEVNKEDYDVPCVFQIWEKKDIDRPQVESEDPELFEYVKPGETYHLAFRRVGGLAGQCFTPQELEAPSVQSHHFLLFDENLDLEEIQKRINAHTFPSNTTGPRSLSKPEINAVLNGIINEYLDETLSSFAVGAQT